MVIEEWWGLNQQIKEVCDRSRGEGFVALGPDVYGREVPIEARRGRADDDGAERRAGRQGPVRRGRLPPGPRGRDAAAASASPASAPAAAGARLATLRPDAVKAVVPYYGLIPWPDAQPDYSELQAAVQGHYAEERRLRRPRDGPQARRGAEGARQGCRVLHLPGTDTFTNHHRPDVFHEEHSDTAWRRVAFFRQQLGSPKPMAFSMLGGISSRPSASARRVRR